MISPGLVIYVELGFHSPSPPPLVCAAVLPFRPFLTSSLHRDFIWHIVEYHLLAISQGQFDQLQFSQLLASLSAFTLYLG